MPIQVSTESSFPSTALSPPSSVLAQPLELRRFPYPYRAMLAICSDLDETPDAGTYFELMRFLNTTEETSMGSGVGLEIGNSIYFDMPPGHFSYWNAGAKDQERIRTLIRSGHIDVLHSYGDLATTRAHAARALEELERHDCRLKVWVDHAQASTNFGSDIMQGHGDERDHPAYHADRTMAYGIRYVWRGRVSSVIGQNWPFSLRHLASDVWSLSSAHRRRTSMLACARTVLKETAKQILGRCGQRKYAFHSSNRLTHTSCLRDRSAVVEFLRCNPHWGGVSSCDTGSGISQVLTSAFLDRLVERGTPCILYTHLGKICGQDPHRPFSDATVQAFRRLAQYQRSGRILITTTRRLLDYCCAAAEITATLERDDDDAMTLSISRGRSNSAEPFNVEEAQGLTIYVPEPERVQIRLCVEKCVKPTINAPDETGRTSVSVPWSKLKFPGF